ncbi:hypothetical protein LOS25_17835 [Enterococcus faecium]|nr:hypothetical protein [Enterococcus faecium]
MRRGDFDEPKKKKRLEEISERLSELKDELEVIQEEEEEYKENIPENLQGSERYEKQKNPLINLKKLLMVYPTY